MLFSLLVEVCFYTKWGNRRCVDAGEKTYIKPTQNAALVISQVVMVIRPKIHPSRFLPHLWVDVGDEGTPTALDFDFVLKLLDRWLTPGPPGPPLFPITCFYDSTENDWKSHFYVTFLLPPTYNIDEFVVSVTNREAWCIGNIKCSVLMRLNEFIIDCS